MDFATNLRNLLEREECSQRAFAKALNLAPSTVGNYVQGVSEPDIETIKRMAAFLGVSTDTLLDYQFGIDKQSRERELLSMFYSLTETEQDLAITQLSLFADFCKNQKNKS